MSDENDLIDEEPTRKNPRLPPEKRSADAPGLRSSAVRSVPVRKRRAGSKSEDHFYIPDELLDQLKERGLSAEFKRLTYFGKEEEPDYHIALQENGWEPLSLKAFPDFARLMSKNWTKDSFEKRGQILMVRPQILTDEARAEDKMVAEGRVKGHLASLTHSKAGEAPRTKPDGTPLASVKRTYERGVPIE
jgi:hypothetical protein